MYASTLLSFAISKSVRYNFYPYKLTKFGEFVYKHLRVNLVPQEPKVVTRAVFHHIVVIEAFTV